jgi:uric acid-xanthine permease
MKNPFKGKSAKETWVGDYDYKYLCMPVIPYTKNGNKPPPFYSKDQWLGIFLAALMGLQHFMAMVGGIITPPILIYNQTFSAYGARDTDIATYLVNAALIMSGLTTLVQVTSFPLGSWRGRKYQLGTGMVSVMGTSFTWLPIAVESILLQSPAQDDEADTWKKAYGAILGTFALLSVIEMMLAFVPPRALRRAVPPLVSGVAVSLIGLGLIGSGFRNWGGGAFCCDNFRGILPPKSLSTSDNLCYVSNSTSADGYTLVNDGVCYAAPIIPKCSPGNGDVALFCGNGAYLGLGLATAGFMVIVELFGSPFLKNCNVVLGLLFGCLISGVTTYNGKSFWNTTVMDSAPVVTFLWTETFPLTLYGPIVIPAIIAYVVTAVESIGDITATEEASELLPEGPDHERRIQGGLLADGVSSVVACLGMSTPNTTFSQNNGVISLTRCASRSAGIACGLWLLLSGIFAKIGAFFVSIPNCVLGGMTTFLFANVFVSGVKIMMLNAVTRRNRFIMAMAFSFGVGVTIVPQWAASPNGLWPLDADMSAALRGLRSTVLIILSTGYAIGTLVAIFLHLILPYNDEDTDMMRSVTIRDAQLIEGSTKGNALFDDGSIRKGSDDVVVVEGEETI